MDEQNIHQFWGFSPSVDLLSVGKSGATHILQVAPYDPRHTLQTMCQASRHDTAADTVHMYVYEDNAEALARHILLLGILFDTSRQQSDRVTMFLEVFGNLFIREETRQYLQLRSKQLENIVSSKIAGSSSGDDDVMGQLLDLGSMRFEAKDKLLAAIVQSRNAPTVDVKHAWDQRSRKWYGDRYDFRKNAIDWDYHMRLVEPSAEPSGCHIIHFTHFRHWRMTGLAFEVRDCQYTVPNSTLVSAAVGRTKEFKNTKCEDVGRGVVATGVWCDILCSPYHSFGVATEHAALLEVSNKQFKHTAVEVARHNVHALLRELRGEGKASVECSLRGAKPSRGPTTAEDLQDAMKAQSLEEKSKVEISEIAPEEPETDAAPAETPAHDPEQPQPQPQPSAVPPTTDSAPPSGEHHDANTACSSTQAAEQQAKLQEAQQVDDSLSTVMKARLGKFRIHCVSGDFVKQLSGRRALKGVFDVATVGVMHAHLLRAQHKLGDVLAPGAAVLVESAENLVQVNRDALEKFRGTVAGWAGEGGLRAADPPSAAPTCSGAAPPKMLPFVKDATAAGGVVRATKRCGSGLAVTSRSESRKSSTAHAQASTISPPTQANNTSSIAL